MYNKFCSFLAKKFYCEYAMFHTDDHGWPLKKERPIRFLLHVLYLYKIAPLICKIKGHDLQSDDYATPDTGYMGCSCNRCGQSWGEILY